MDVPASGMSDWTKWGAMLVSLIALAVSMANRRSDRRRDGLRRSRELQETVMRLKSALVRQCHHLLPGLGAMQDRVFRIMMFRARGAEGPTGSAALDEWQLDCSHFRNVDDWTVFDARLELRILYVQAQAILFNNLMRQRALDQRSPIEQALDVDKMLQSLLAATLEVSDKLMRTVSDVYAEVHKTDAPFPFKRPTSPLEGERTAKAAGLS